MTRQQRIGQAIVLMLIALILLLSLGVIALYMSTLGTRKLLAQTVRFVLEAALCYWVYTGSRVAKWIMVVLMGLASGLAFVGLAYVLLSSTPSDNPLVLVFFIGMAVVYLSFAVVLLASSSVKAFLDYQQGQDKAV